MIIDQTYKMTIVKLVKARESFNSYRNCTFLTLIISQAIIKLSEASLGPKRHGHHLPMCEAWPTAEPGGSCEPPSFLCFAVHDAGASRSRHDPLAILIPKLQALEPFVASNCRPFMLQHKQSEINPGNCMPNLQPNIVGELPISYSPESSDFMKIRLIILTMEITLEAREIFWAPRIF